MSEDTIALTSSANKDVSFIRTPDILKLRVNPMYDLCSDARRRRKDAGGRLGNVKDKLSLGQPLPDLILNLLFGLDAPDDAIRT